MIKSRVHTKLDLASLFIVSMTIVGLLYAATAFGYWLEKLGVK